ncbi:hypothetical protein [Bradyrhizobium sp. USDA 4350]
MPTIKFVRVERDCDANRNARAAAEQVGTSPRLIYDFDVMIDGEKRATMRRVVYGKGYELQDADGRPLAPTQRNRVGREVDSKAEFLTIVTQLLDAGEIPTLTQLAEKREAEARERAEAIQAKKDSQRRAAIQHHAEAMYDALKTILTDDPVASARDVLKAVEADVKEWTAAVDADPGAFGIY